MLFTYALFWIFEWTSFSNTCFWESSWAFRAVISSRLLPGFTTVPLKGLRIMFRQYWFRSGITAGTASVEKRFVASKLRCELFNQIFVFVLFFNHLTSKGAGWGGSAIWKGCCLDASQVRFYRCVQPGGAPAADQRHAGEVTSVFSLEELEEVDVVVLSSHCTALPSVVTQTSAESLLERSDSPLIQEFPDRKSVV